MKQNKLSEGELSHLLTGSLIIAFMLLLPYSFYLYTYFPDEPSFKTKFFSIRSVGFESLSIFFYYLFSKLIPLSLLLIWFTTCKHWWYYSIAIPISLYVFQLISIIYENTGPIDEMEFIYSLPITIIILAILFFIRSKLSVYLKAKDIKKEMDEQMSKPLKRRKIE